MLFGGSILNVDFEVDSKRIVDYFKQSNEDIIEFGVIMDSSIHYCSLYLTNSHVKFTMK